MNNQNPNAANVGARRGQPERRLEGMGVLPEISNQLLVRFRCVARRLSERLTFRAFQIKMTPHP